MSKQLDVYDAAYLYLPNEPSPALYGAAVILESDYLAQRQAEQILVSRLYHAAIEMLDATPGGIAVGSRDELKELHIALDNAVSDLEDAYNVMAKEEMP